MQLTRRLHHPAGDLFAEFDRLFRTPLGLASEHAHGRVPRGFSLYETDSDWRLRADIPGFSKEDVAITLKEGVLTITANRGDEVHGFSGNLEQSLRVPKDIATERISASLADGVLELTLPKQEPETPETTRIEIN